MLIKEDLIYSSEYVDYNVSAAPCSCATELLFAVYYLIVWRRHSLLQRTFVYTCPYAYRKEDFLDRYLDWNCWVVHIPLFCQMALRSTVWLTLLCGIIPTTLWYVYLWSGSLHQDTSLIMAGILSLVFCSLLGIE